MQINQAAEYELRMAHQIIANALNIMTPAQKKRWADKNSKDGVDGEGVTRANERMAVFTRLMDGEK